MIRFNYYSNEMLDLPANVHCKGDVNVPGPSAQETALQEQQLQILQEQRAQNELMKPYLYQLAGIKEVDGQLVPMTEEEQYATMTTAQRQQYDVSKLQLDQYSKALKGELPLSQAVENELGKQRANLESYMSRKLGPNWQQSTPGIQALAEFDKQANALREEQMYGKQTGASAMSIAQQQAYNQMLGQAMGTAQSPLSNNAGLFGLTGQAMQPYQAQRQMQLQASMLNSQMSNQRNIAMWEGIGKLGGNALMAYGLSA